LFSFQEESPLSLPFIYTIHDEQLDMWGSRERERDGFVFGYYKYGQVAVVFMGHNIDNVCNNDFILVIFSIEFHPLPP
jgi:hypothetical protein